MQSGSDRNGEEFGSEYYRRLSPELAARERRSAFWAGLVGIGLGVMCLGLAVDATRRGDWVDFDRVGGSLILPGWVVGLIGLFLIYTSSWVIWRFARKA